MAISHTTRNQFAFGGGNGPAPQYFISPLGIYHIILGAEELKQDTSLSLEGMGAFSAYANLRPNNLDGTRVLMSLPVVQGMGMATALYDRAKPVIQTTVFFRSLNYLELVNGVTHKYRIVLNDGSYWLLYATSLGSVGTPPFVLNNSSMITGPANFVGSIQVTKNPAGEDQEGTFDYSAGAYAINATITGTASGAFGSYTLRYGKSGVADRPLLMYALPHHVESFDQRTQAALTNISLVTTTKGFARAIVSDQMTMIENDLPDTIGFAPWAKNPNGAAGGSENINLNSQALALINQAGISELSQDMIPQTRLNSMYYSGKGLAKFAAIIYTMNSMTGNSQYAAAGLDRLKDAFNVFVNNTQPEPLVYDTVWKGVVSGASFREPYDTGLDFGNSLYNDHHFHYGYFVYTAAVIGHLDPTWLDQGTNKVWVNSLVRDYANPVADRDFPFQRSFDWFHGHSWAKGLFESGDGKDQESTSEDTFATYALKMWGRIIQDPNMEARGNLMLAVQKRSLRNYFLLESTNMNQPPQFVPNKVTGILFENKVDHTTYFGANIEYIQGIHMIPLNPSSAYTRSSNFVQEEWDTYFSNGRADNVNGGWRSILKANQALIDAQASYDFFASPDFSGEQLDGGASRTWYLAYSAALLSARTVGSVEDPQMDYNSTGPEVPMGPVPMQSGPVVTGPLPLQSAAAVPRVSAQSAVPISSRRPDDPVDQEPVPTSSQTSELSEFYWLTPSGKEPLSESTSTPTHTVPAVATPNVAANVPVESGIDTLDMSWALQDKAVEERDSDDEWEFDLDCDDEDGAEDRQGSWWDLVL
jgi:endo-1,3(4)-beta-glucanase